jgi:hypothetical protein
MPDVGSLVLLQNRFDTGQAETIKTLPVSPTAKAEAYRRGENVYRGLSSGEHDIASGGYAMTFWGRRGHLDLRSGSSVKAQLSREQLEITQRAPTHRTELFQQAAGTMGDEERLGVVKRWKSASEEYYVKQNGRFLSEHYTQLLNPNNSGPSILFRHIEGDVVDDAGQLIRHTTTALPLRSQSLWYTTTDETTKEERDENGNYFVELPSTASTGYEVLIPEGSYRKIIGKDRNVTIEGDEVVQVRKDITYTVSQNVTYDVKKNHIINAGPTNLSLLQASDTVQLHNGSSYGIKASPSAVNIDGPSGSKMEIGAAGTVMVDAKTMLELKVDALMKLEGQIFQGNFMLLNLGLGAVIPATMGLAVQAYLDSHQHTSSLPGLPTSPPLIPSSSLNGTPQSILSTKILLAGNI